MENKTEPEFFRYSYSAKQQEEIQAIRKKYLKTESGTKEDKMEQLRRLDASVTRRGTIASLIAGILGALILGIGMCCCLVWSIFVWGIAIGMLGIVFVLLAYPLYTRLTKKDRERIAPEIIRLTDELMQ